MFAGIVEGTVPIQKLTPQKGGVRLTLDAGPLADDISKEDSIAVNGVCLTVVAVKKTVVAFDVITETLKKTTFGQLRAGDHVNIERSMRAGDRIDGHFVQGHVDGVGKVVEKIVTKKEYKLWFSAPKLKQYITPRGSIAINGVSLTIAEVEKDRFAVALIPTTLEKTNLSQLAVGDMINIEADIISKQIVHWLEAQAGQSVTSTTLAA